VSRAAYSSAQPDQRLKMRLVAPASTFWRPNHQRPYLGRSDRRTDNHVSSKGRGEMTCQVGQPRQESGCFGVLRAASAIAVAAGAAGSVGLLLHAGQRIDSPRFLMGLFAIWVLSPFVILVGGYVFSKRWSVLTRATLYGVMLVVTVASLAIYGVVALGPSRPKAASFVLVPPLSWLLMAIAVPTASFISRRWSR
jgi:hypothetical protein